MAVVGQHPILRSSLALVAGLATCLSFSVIAHSQERLVRLPVAASSASVDPQSGTVAITNLPKNQVWLLQPDYFAGNDAAKVGAYAGARRPTSVCWKRFGNKSYLAIGCFDEIAVKVVSAKDMSEVHSVRSTSSAATFVSASRDPKDPFIYVSGKLLGTPAWGVVQLGPQFPLLTTLGRYGKQAPIPRALATESGRQILLWNPSEKSVFLHAVHLGDQVRAAEFEEVSELPVQEPASASTALVPHDRGLVVGRSLSGGGRKLPQRLPFEPLCVLRTRPVAVGLKGNVLGFADLSTGKLVGTKELPAALFPKSAPEEFTVNAGSGLTMRYVARPIIVEDSVSKRLLVFNGNQAAALDIDKLGISANATVEVKLNVPNVMHVGIPFTLPVQTNPGAEIRLESGPDGMSLRDGKLIWTPAAKQLGAFNITLSASAAGRVVRQQFFSRVINPPYPCPFPARRVALDREGKRLVAWTTTNTRSGAGRGGTSRTDIAVFHTATRQIVAKGVLSQQLLQVLVTPTQIAIVTMPQPGLVRLELLTHELTSIAVRDIPDIKGRKMSLRLVKDHWHFHAEGLSQAIRFGPDFATRNATVTRSRTGRTSRTASVVSPERWYDGRVEGGWAHGGIFFDATDKPQLVLGLPGLVAVGPTHYWNAAWPRPPLSGGWTPTARSVGSRRNQQLPFYGPATMVSHELGCKLTLALEPKGIMTRVDLVAHDAAGNELERWPVMVMPAIKEYRQPHASFQWSVNGTKCAFAADGRVLLFDLSSLKRKRFTRPLIMTPRQSLFVAPLGKPARLTVSATGGKTPYQFSASLPLSQRSTTREPYTKPVANAPGSFDVDVDRYVKENLAALIQAVYAKSFKQLRGRQANVEDLDKRYRDRLALQFQRITGRAPKGVPIGIPVAAKVLDSDLQSSTVEFLLIVELPESLVQPQLLRVLTGMR